jgi:hypothetical protein
MRIITATVDKEGGYGHFAQRLKEFPNEFLMATGEVLVGGTLNLKADRKIPIREHFRMPDPWEAEHQVLLFEVCPVLGQWAYRVRPVKSDKPSEGGHGGRCARNYVREVDYRRRRPSSTWRHGGG